MNKINLHINETKIRRLPLVLLLTCLPLFTTTMRGQSNGISLDVPRIVPVSPAVTEMGKYQFYPVSHCTGIPDITIPLYLEKLRFVYFLARGGRYLSLQLGDFYRHSRQPHEPLGEPLFG